MVNQLLGKAQVVLFLWVTRKTCRPNMLSFILGQSKVKSTVIRDLPWSCCLWFTEEGNTLFQCPFSSFLEPPFFSGRSQVLGFFLLLQNVYTVPPGIAALSEVTPLDNPRHTYPHYVPPTPSQNLASPLPCCETGFHYTTALHLESL